MKNHNKNEILLETGTNEMEIMEFLVGSSVFGINVAKVREILIAGEVKKMPHSHPAIEGVFKPRDEVITVVNLPSYLNIEGSEIKDKNIFIVTEFNQMCIAFRVDTVVGIDRISWEDIQKPDKSIYGGTDGIATGIAQCEGRLITILDFEKIMADIVPSSSIKVEELKALGERPRDSRPIVMAEDSMLLSKLMLDSLNTAGYTNIIQFSNGKEAWDYLFKINEDPDLKNKVSLIITDIEMPQMDGHRLTKLIKENRNLKSIPVVIFSSLITEQMYVKGKQVGADEQLSKPEIGHLVEVIDGLLHHKN